MSCSQSGCNEPCAFVYDWPGSIGGRACVKHAQLVEKTAKAMGFHVTLHPFEMHDEPPSEELVRLCSDPGHVWYGNESDDAEGRPLCIDCGGRGPVNYAQRKPYDPPQATKCALTPEGELARLELLALQEHLDAHGQFHGPAFRAWASLRIERCKKLLDNEICGKLASCRCVVNPLRLAIVETNCPICGGKR